MIRRINLLYQSLFSSHMDPNNTTFYFLCRLHCDPQQTAMNERLQAHFRAPCNNIYIGPYLGRLERLSEYKLNSHITVASEQNKAC